MDEDRHQDLGFRVWGLGLRVDGSRLKEYGTALRLAGFPKRGSPAISRKLWGLRSKVSHDLGPFLGGRQYLGIDIV